MDEWQPIETAPKDGTFILLGWAGKDIVAMARYAFCDHPRNSEGRGWIAWIDTLGLTNVGHMTHWMPLPAPPTGSAK